MRPLSGLVPKPLLFCAGMTLIQRLIRSFMEAGVRKFTVGVGWKGDQVRKHLTALPESRLIDVVDVPEYKRGPLQTLVTALSNVDDRTFLVCPADYIVEGETISGLISEHDRGTGPRVMTILVDSNKNEGTPVFGDANGLVAGIGDSAVTFNNVGCSAMLLVAEQSFKADCGAALKEGSTQVVSAINRIVSENKPVRYAVVKQQWFDIDDLSALMRVNHHLLEHMTSSATGTLFVPSGQEVDWRTNLSLSVKLDQGAKVTGPALVCESSLIGGEAIVGPFVTIGRNSHVGARTTVVESVLFEGANLPAGARVENAAVYRKTVYRSESKDVP